MNDKHYISGSIKEIESNGGKFYSMSLKLDDLASCEVNDKWYIRLNMSKRKEVDQYWNSHYLVENDWKPTWNNNQSKQEIKKEDEISVEDIPF